MSTSDPEGAETANKVGIKDVAAAAGVSITTVSHALNDKGRLSETTRSRVRAVAKRLGYRANSSARHLAGGRTGVIELVLNEKILKMFATDGLTYYAHIMAAASATCAEYGYSLALAGSAPPGRPADARPDGVLGIDPLVDEAIWGELAREGIPSVTVGRMIGSDAENWVDNDHRAAALLVFKHLHARGARQIALIGSDVEASFEEEIRAAYEEWCADRGQPLQIEIAHADFFEAGGDSAMRRLASASPRPDAVFATASRVAIGVLRACEELSIAVPRDLMLVAGNDNQLALWGKPPFTTVNVAPDELARRSIEMLIDRIESSEPEPGPVIIPVRLVERESTARGAV